MQKINNNEAVTIGNDKFLNRGTHKPLKSVQHVEACFLSGELYTFLQIKSAILQTVRNHCKRRFSESSTNMKLCFALIGNISLRFTQVINDLCTGQQMKLAMRALDP